MSITVLGHALKIVNKGGGYQQKMIREEVPVLTGKKRFRSNQYESRERVPGSDYIVFKCPMCSKRNKRVSYDAKESGSDGRLILKCSGCYNDIAVQRPISLAGPNDLGPGMIAKTGGILGPDGKPIR